MTDNNRMGRATFNRRLLASAGSLLVLSVAAPGAAWAQDQTATAQTPVAGTEEEIFVTAQRREQALSDVSLSVTAVGGDELVNTNTYNIEALQNLVPSMSFGNDFNFAKLFIRGIGLSSSLPGVDPSVALHVDGVVVSLAQAQLGSMFDLERVEVLRGPQGTLYGRNATGGAVNLITAQADRRARRLCPGDDWRTRPQPGRRSRHRRADHRGHPRPHRRARDRSRRLRDQRAAPATTSTMPISSRRARTSNSCRRTICRSC